MLFRSMILIPLEVGSRGDQVDNAKSFQKRFDATILREPELSAFSLNECIDHSIKEKENIAKKIKESYTPIAKNRVVDLLASFVD